MLVSQVFAIRCRSGRRSKRQEGSRWERVDGWFTRFPALLLRQALHFIREKQTKEDEMPILVFFMLLFIGIALIWVVAAGLLLGTVISGIPGALDKMLDYKGEHCVCHFPFMHQT
jgi:hypothetical protein